MWLMCLTICEKSLQRKLVPSHNIEITNWKDQIIMKILLFSVLILLTDGANILILHPVYSGSHEHVLRTVGEHLVENRGHNVTQVNGSGLPFSRLKGQISQIWPFWDRLTEIKRFVLFETAYGQIWPCIFCALQPWNV